METFKTFISEMAPPPDDWDKEIFRQSFDAQVEYALQRAERINAGSSRVVFEIQYSGRPTILKIAHNEKGLAQNKEECIVLSQANTDIVIPLIDYDQDNTPPRWLHVEKATSITEADFEDIVGFTFEDFSDLIMNNIEGRSLPPNDRHDLIVESELFNETLSLIFDFNILADDICLIDNWGLYQGKLVLVDVGLTEDLCQIMYRS